MDEISEILSQVARGQCNAITIARDMEGPGKASVAVNMKQERVMPERMESPARAHTFHTAEGFIEYVKAEKTERTLVLADITRACVNAILNDRAKHGFEGVSLEPALDPRFALLTKTLLHGNPTPIAEFALAVMRNRNVMAGHPAKAQQLAILMQQITVSSEITACSADLGIGLNGVLCKTSVKAGEGKTQVNIPSSIAVKLPIYLNTPEVEFDLDITLSATRNGEVIVSIDAPELELRKYEVFETILAKIRGVDGIAVAYGWCGVSGWQYNK